MQACRLLGQLVLLDPMRFVVLVVIVVNLMQK